MPRPLGGVLVQALDALAVACATLAITVLLCLAWVRRLRRRLRETRHSARSLATRHGQATEHFVPFMAHWPWDPKGFRFLGSPVDGIQFAPDAVVFVEVKTGSSRLSDEQKRIKALVEAGRVAWREVRIG